MTNLKKLTLILCLTAYSLLLIPHVYAQDPTFDNVNEVAKKLNCPTCRGISLSNCPTQTCEQWRAQIGDLLKQGYNENQILEQFSQRYGAQVLQEPPKHGSTLWLWLLPLMTLLVGGVWVMYLLRRWQLAPAMASRPTKTPAPISDYLNQVDRDLENG